MSEAAVEVQIFDTTMRDGAQSLPTENQFPTGTKPAIARALAKFGVRTIEAGFPRTSGDAEEVEEVARTVGREVFPVGWWRNGTFAGNTLHTPVITGLSRANREDIDATWAAVQVAKKPGIHTFVSTDSEHMKAKFPGKTPDDIVAMTKDSVAYVRHLAKAAGRSNDTTIEFSAEAASTTDLGFLERVIKTSVNAGANIVNVPDTVGQRDPFWMHEFYKRVIEWVVDINPTVTVSAHNHNDIGMAVANSRSLVTAAQQTARERDVLVRTQIEATVCGLGERAGNADVFPVMAGLHHFTPEVEVPVRWQINPGQAVSTARTVMEFARLAVPPQSPIVGSDILTHRSGIHSDGVIRGGHRLYTPFDPQFWGHAENARHEEGKYQGEKGRRATGR